MNNLEFYYKLAKEEGYQKDINSFVDLLKNDDETVEVIYDKLVNEHGYGNDIEYFTSELRGLPLEFAGPSDASKKKEDSGSSTQLATPQEIASASPSGSEEQRSSLEFGFDADTIGQQLAEEKKSRDLSSMMDEGFQAEYEEEVKRFREEHKVGDIKGHTGPQGGNFVYWTEESIQKEIDKISNKYKSQAQKKTRDYFKEQIMPLIPEDKKDDEEYLDKLNNYLAQTYGVDPDFDGDGRYNEQTMVEEWAKGLSAASINLFKGAMASTVGAMSPLPYNVANEIAFQEFSGLEEDIRKSNVQYSNSSILDESGWQGAYNALRRTSTAAVESIPVVAVSSVSSPYVAGALSGVSAAHEAYYGGHYDGPDGERGATQILLSMGEGTVLGVGDAFIGAKLNSIFKNSGKEVATGTLRHVIAGKLRGYGVDMSEEALTEGSVAAAELIYKSLAGSSEAPASLDAAINEVVENMVMGGAAGGYFKGAGEAVRAGARKLGFNSEVAAANSRADLVTDDALRNLNQIIEDLEAELGIETDQTRMGEIYNEIVSAYDEVGRIRAEKLPFYEMLKYRAPEALSELNGIDAEVAKLFAEHDKVTGIKAGDPVVKSQEQLERERKKLEPIENRIKELVEQRLEITNRFKGESLELSSSEKARRNENGVNRAVNLLNSDIDMAEADLDDLIGKLSGGIVSPQAVEAAQSRVDELKKKRSEVRKLLGEADQARRAWAEAVDDAGAEGTDIDEIDVLRERAKNAMDMLAVSLGIDPTDVNEAYSKEGAKDIVDSIKNKPKQEEVVEEKKAEEVQPEEAQDVEEEVTTPKDPVEQGVEEIVEEATTEDTTGEETAEPEESPKITEAFEPLVDPSDNKQDREYNPNSDGTYGVREGDVDGIDAETASLLNNLLNQINKLSGGNVTLRIFKGPIPNNPDANGTFTYEGGNKVISISIDQINTDAAELSSSLKEKGIDNVLVHNLKQVILEESAHALQTTAIAKSSKEQSIKFLKDALGAINMTPDLRRRLGLKVSAYLAEYVADFSPNFDPYTADPEKASARMEAVLGADVYALMVNEDPSLQDILDVIESIEPRAKDAFDMAVDEFIADAIGFAAQDPALQKDRNFYQKVAAIINNFMQSAGLDFRINSETEAEAYVRGFYGAASGRQSLVSPNINPDFSRDYRSSAESRRVRMYGQKVSPAKLPNEGKFSVDFKVPRTSFGEYTGEYSDQTRTFNGKWDFVRWWRYTTKDGVKPFKDFVATVDGKQIQVDADAISKWNLKPLAPPKNTRDELRKTELAVVEYVNGKYEESQKYTTYINDQGREVTAESSNYDLNKAILAEIAKRITGEMPQYPRDVLARVNAYDLMKVTDEVLSELKGETPTESIIRESGGIGAALKVRGTGYNPKLRMERERARAGVSKRTATELEKMSAFYYTVGNLRANVSPARLKTFINEHGVKEVQLIDYLLKKGGRDLNSIFRDTKKATSDYMVRMSDALGKDVSSFEPIFHVFSAITSNGIALGPNIKMAKALFHQGMINMKDQGKFFDANLLDAFLKKRGIKLSGPRAEVMRKSLLNFCQFFGSDQGKDFFDDKGNLKKADFISWLSNPVFERTNGTTVRNLHTLMSTAKDIKNSTTIKLPNYALSLLGADGEFIIPDLNVMDVYNTMSGVYYVNSKATEGNRKLSIDAYNLHEEILGEGSTASMSLAETVRSLVNSRSSLDEDRRKKVDRFIEKAYGIDRLRATDRKSNVEKVAAFIADIRDKLNQNLDDSDQKWTLQTVSQALWLSGRASKVGDLTLGSTKLMNDYIGDTSTDIIERFDVNPVDESNSERANEIDEEISYAMDPDRDYKTIMGMIAETDLMDIEGEFEASSFENLYEEIEVEAGTEITYGEDSSLRLPDDIANKVRNFEAVDPADIKSAAGMNQTATVDRLGGIEVSIDPFHNGAFVDKNGRVIESAKNVFIHNGKTYVDGKIKYAAGRPKKTGEYQENPPQAELDKLAAYYSEILGVTYDSRADLVDAYNSLPAESKAKLKTSEAAKNIKSGVTRKSASLRLRQTARRQASAYPEIRNDVIQNPENYISRQKLQPIKDKLKTMSQEDLVNLMTNDALGRLQNRNDDVGVLAGAELIRRKIAEGDVDAIPSMIEELSKIGTTAGRILRHFRELKGSTPEGLASIFIKAAEKRGNKLTTDQETRVKKLMSELYRIQNEHRQLMERAIRGEDVEQQLKDKTAELKNLERELDTMANALIEKGWGQIGQMLIQGNLLTPMSQFTNVGANLVNAMVKAPIDILALPIEKLANAFGFESPMKRNFSLNAYMYGIRRFGSGFVEALDQIITGQEGDVTEWRVTRGFAPFRSIVAAYRGGDMLPLGPDGKASASQRAKLFVQGTLGVPAEVMFRFLSLGDTPFRRMVEGHELYQAGLAMGLKGEALKAFLKYPTKEQMDRAAREGRRLTYQEETVASKMAEDATAFFERMFARAFDWIPAVDGRAFGKFFVRANLPYVRTPANILYDTLTFVTPYVAIPRMLAELNGGDTRAASQTLAKLVIGTTAAQTAAMLVKEGLMSGTIEWDEEEEKNIAYDQFPPNSINVSGLKRWLNGEDTSKRNDDYFISYNKLGVVGAIFGAMAKSTNKDEVEIDPFSVNYMLRNAFGVSAFSSISHMMDQSFLQGMTGLIDVISSADVDDLEQTSERWFGSMFQAVSATVLPNTLSSLNRMDREYMPDVRITKDMPYEERILKKFIYTIKDRTFNTDGIPVRVNWKGEPIEQTPRGTTSIAYQIFDISKARQGEDDAVSNEIWRLYEATEDLTKAVGTPYYAQKKKINVPSISTRTKKEKTAFAKLGKKYTFMDDEEFVNGTVALNTEQINRVMAISGKQRYRELEALISSQAYLKMSDKERVEAMNEINDSYNSLKEYDGDSFKPHTIAVFDAIEEQYKNIYGRQ